MEILTERNQSVNIYFPLVLDGSTDFAPSGIYMPASGDIQYSVDGASFSNTSNLPSYVGNGIWNLPVVAGEVIGKRTVITVVASGIDSQSILLQTWGDDSAGLSFNALADFVLKRPLASGRASSWGGPITFRSLLGAGAKLVNRLYRSGSDLLTTEEDDSTTFGTQAITSSAGAEQITDLDTA